MNKFIRYCEGIMEAGWLTALLSLPLFFNFRGESVESEKNYLLRSLALVILAAWGMAGVGKLGLRSHQPNPTPPSPASICKTPLVIIAAIVAITVVISTFLSVSPRISFWGLVNRRVGSYTYLSCFAIFVAMISRIRSQAQVDRLITAGIISTIPVSLYGIGQAFAIEPIMRAGGPNMVRVGSTFAHAIYLGAYLIMLFPLTLSRSVLSYLTWRGAQNPGYEQLLRGVLYSFIAALQLAAIFLTVSRGPFVGLIVGFSVMFLMLSVYLRRRWLAVATFSAALALLAAFAMVVKMTRPEEIPVAVNESQPLSEFVDPQSGSAGERAAAWRAAVHAARFNANFSRDEGTPQRFSVLRALLGYGPECVGFVSRLYSLRDFNLKVPDHILFDRFHNDFWDTLITTGALGIASNIALASIIVFSAFKWIGFIATPRLNLAFWSILASFGALGTIGMAFHFGVEFLGVGLSFGLASGAVVYLLLLSWQHNFNREVTSISLERSIVIMAFVSGIAAHLMEIPFSFTFETSLLYFWTYTAALLVVGYILPVRERTLRSNEEKEQNANSPLENSPELELNRSNPILQQSRVKPSRISHFGRGLWDAWQAEASGALLMAVVLANIGFMLIQKTEAQSAFRLIVDSLTKLPGNKNAVTGCLLLGIALTILIFAAIWTIEFCPKASGKDRLRSLSGTAAVGVLLGLGYWVLFASHTVSSLSIASVTLGTVSQFLQERVFILDVHYAFMAGLILTLGPFVAQRPANSASDARRWPPLLTGGLAILLGFGACLIIYKANMSRSKSGMMDKLSKEEFFRRQDNWPTAVAVIEAAIQTAPNVDTPYLWLGKVLIEQAVASQDAKDQLKLFAKANDVLLAGSRLNPLDAAFRARRANLILKRALTERSLDERQALARQAIEFHQKATTLDPGNFNLWNNMAYVHLTILRSMDDAYLCLQRSLDLQPKGHPAYGLLGDVFFQKGFATKPSKERQSLLQSAVTNYQKAIALSGAFSPGATYRYTVGLGKAYFNSGDLSHAITAYQRAADLSPSGERWRNEEILARLHSDIKDRSNALEHLRRALELAPPEKNSNLMQLRSQILAAP